MVTRGMNDMVRVLSIAAILSLIIGATSCLAEVPDAPPAADASTVLLWHFDEGVGETASDASGNGLDGVVSGAEWVEGRFGKALQWTEENGQVSVATDLAAITDRFTLQAWIKLDQLPTGTPPLWASDVAGKLGSVVMTVRPPGVLYVGVTLGESRHHLTGTQDIPVGEWTHIALVYDGPSRKIGTFVNGQTDLEVTVPAGEPSVNKDPARQFFVRSYGGTDEKLVGAIDEVCLSNDAKLFGNEWAHAAHLHALRYTSELMLLSEVPPAHSNPPLSYRISVTDAAGAEVFAADVPAADAAGGKCLPVEMAEGDYHAQVTATLADGTERVMWDRNMLWTPPDRSVWDLTADNVLLREGEPVFPLMAYHVRQKDLGLMADSAINIAKCWTTTYPPDWEKPGDGVGYVEACTEAGVLSVCSGGGMYAEGVQERVASHYRGNRDLVFYYVADEPHGPGRQPDDMLNRAEAWNRLDPSHVAFLLHNRPTQFTWYSPACDVFATDAYPLRRPEDTDMTRVANWARAAVDSVAWRKPVWMALQCYTTRSTEDSTASRDMLPRLPTTDELRCMSYMSLAEGCRGLLYYSFDDTYYNRNGIRGVNIAEEFPEFWAGMCGVIEELAAHSDVWTMPYADMPEPTCSNEKIIVQRRPYASEGKAYVLVVNPERDVQDAWVQLAGLTGVGQVQDALGGAPADIRDGLIMAELQPLQSQCFIVPLN